MGRLPISAEYLKEMSYRYNSSNLAIFAPFYIVSLITKIHSSLRSENV